MTRPSRPWIRVLGTAVLVLTVCPWPTWNRIARGDGPGTISSGEPCNSKSGLWRGSSLRLPLALADSAALEAGRIPVTRKDVRILGAATCAAAACHGGPRPGIAEPGAIRSTEYALWLERDPHAHSWRTLCSEESTAMLRRLRIMDGETIIDPSGFDNCLACHNSTIRYQEARHVGRLAEGVGCAACHGPEERWIDSHYQYGSGSATPQDGWVPLENLLARARLCATCHVGDADRDMNHDLIAAGHPALRYEFATYHAWEPRHWRDPRELDERRFEAQLWLAGQIAALDASLELLAARARKSHTVSTWPEFSEYDCGSCHRDLRVVRGRTEGRGAPQATYAAWNRAGMQFLLRHRSQSGQNTVEDLELEQTLSRLVHTMNSRVQPDRLRTEVAARNAQRALRRWLDGAAGQTELATFDAWRLKQLAAGIGSSRDVQDSWEAATQWYLAAVAARGAWRGGWEGPVYPQAQQVQRILRYPKERGGPRWLPHAGEDPASERARWDAAVRGLTGDLSQ